MNPEVDGLVSVIIPTYYRNNLLPEAIESALDQDYRPIEVIVVDDSGESHAQTVVSDYDSVTFVPLDENVGENPARTAGLEIARGEYVQFLDDDDILCPDKLSRQVPLLDEETGVVYSGLRYYESREVILPVPDVRGEVLKPALEFDLWPPCYTSTLLVERAKLEPVLPLKYHGAGDTTFMIKLAQLTEFDFVDAPLVEKRLDVDSLGFSMANVRNKRRLLDEYASLYDQYPSSHRAALAHIYRQEGSVLLDGSGWSQRAIRSLALATYYASDRASRRETVAELCLALFGHPGKKARGLATNFATAWRKDGPTHALRKAADYARK